MRIAFNTESSENFLKHAQDFFQRKIDDVFGYKQCLVKIDRHTYPFQIEITKNKGQKQASPHTILAVFALFQALNDKTDGKIHLATDGKSIKCITPREDDLCRFARRFFEDFHNDCYDDSYLPLMEMETSCTASSFQVEHPTAFQKDPYKKQFPKTLTS